MKSKTSFVITLEHPNDISLVILRARVLGAEVNSYITFNISQVINIK